MGKLKTKGIKVILVGALAMGLILTGCSTKTEEAVATTDTAVTGTEENPESLNTEGDEGITHPYELAPELNLVDLSGNAVNLSDYKGKYVMVNFWATWCKYCDQEMPDLMAFQEKYKDELKVIAIDVKEDQKTVEAYVKEKGIDLTIAMDESGKVAEAYYVNSFPTTFFIDRAGKVIGFVPGMLTAKDMETTYGYLKENDTVKD